MQTIAEYERLINKDTKALQEIVDNIPGGICLFNLKNGSLIFGNIGFYELTNFTSEEIDQLKEGHTLDTFIGKIERNKMKKLVTEALAKGKNRIEMELPIFRHNKDKLWVLLKGNIFEIEEERYINCVLMDITKRKRMEKEMELNERLLSIALEQTDSIVFEAEIQANRVQFKNGHFEGMLPEGPIENATKELTELGLIHRNYQRDFEEMWGEISEGAEIVSKELLVQYKKGGAPFWVKATLRSIYSEDGHAVRAVGIFENISSQKETETAFIKEETYRQAMMAKMIASAEVNLTKNRVEKVTGAWAKRKANLKLSFDKLMGELISNDIFEEDRETLTAMMERQHIVENYGSEGEELELEYRRLDENGEPRWMRMRAHIVKDPVSGDMKLLVYAKDIDKQKKIELATKYKSERDSLTGLYNKGTAELKMRIFLGRDFDETVCHAFIIMDLDNFKSLNDTHGHQYGDLVLKGAADILNQAFRQDDIVGRLGGDEMVILMKNIPDRECLKDRMEMIRERLSKLSREGVHVSASIGISLFDEHGSDYDELYRTADVALYRAKQQGRDQFVIYDLEMEL